MVGNLGLEPRTCGLLVRVARIELALPTTYGLAAPITSYPQDRCSNLLSQFPINLAVSSRIGIFRASIHPSRHLISPRVTAGIPTPAKRTFPKMCLSTLGSHTLRAPQLSSRRNIAADTNEFNFRQTSQFSATNLTINLVTERILCIFRTTLRGKRTPGIATPIHSIDSTISILLALTSTSFSSRRGRSSKYLIKPSEDLNFAYSNELCYPGYTIKGAGV